MPLSTYTLKYKPGIQRDGTDFQSTYCPGGQWVRFQRGVIKKIGGMKGFNFSFRDTDATTLGFISNMYLTLSQTSSNVIGFLGTANADAAPLTSRVYKFVLPPNSGQAVVAPFVKATGIPNAVWQFEPIIRNGVRTLVCFATPSANNIAQNTAPLLISGSITEEGGDPAFTPTAINPLANGGVCYSEPYLFIYGSNGFVAYSRNNDPLNFVPNVANGGGELKISNDKVIYGRPIRGGTNSPCLLFWSLSTVVRITNVGDQQVNFQIEVIAKDVSILSSRCVVEYNGYFFWPGTDAFYVWNGTVDRLDNNFSLNYFFDNLDITQRQQVFGVKKPKFNEIWWYYPVKGEVGNFKVLIYNIKLNCWYDSQTRAKCGFFSSELGKTFIYGEALEQSDGYNYLWQHETDTNQDWYPRFLGANTRDIIPITSSVTTPVFSWVAFNPAQDFQQQGVGIDQWTDLTRVEPDFLMDNDTDVMNMTVQTREYAQSPVISSNPVGFTRTTGKIDMNIQGRYVNFQFSSTANFEFGRIMLGLAVGDGQ